MTELYGIDKLIDPLEKRLGKSLTYVLLFLIFLAISVTCIDVIFTKFISQIIDIYRSFSQEDRSVIERTLDTTRFIGSVLTYIFVVVGFMFVIEIRNERRRIAEITQASRDMLQTVKDTAKDIAGACDDIALGFQEIDKSKLDDDDQKYINKLFGLFDEANEKLDESLMNMNELVILSLGSTSKTIIPDDADK